MGSADWYARKLGRAPTAPAAPTSYPATAAPLQAVPQQYVTPGSTPPVAPVPVDGQSNMGEAITRWQGGEGTKTEVDRCPRCDSPNYFSRRSGALTTPNGRMTPAPHCYDCGHNGLWEQFGNQNPE